ncbi:MAG: NusG domain II-containing protein [Eubacteriaceae bacterium]|jgi:hypothetical protein
MKKRDLWIIIGILVFGTLISFLSRQAMDSGKQVRVSIDNEVVDVFDLDKDTEKDYQTQYGENDLVIKDKKVYIDHADCTNQICVQTQPVSDVGETIACLPHKLIVEVISE